MVLANYHPGDANTFFGNQNWNMSDGEATLISSGCSVPGRGDHVLVTSPSAARPGRAAGATRATGTDTAKTREQSGLGPDGVPGVSTAASDGQLRAEDVSFAYVGAARAALRHVNLGVAPGEVVLITGASGCGKSTLALALCGLIPTRVHGELRGRVTFGGTALSGMKPHEASQLVGMVFQNPNLQLINQTVQSEVAFGPENLALPQPEIAARVDWCLDVTGMDAMRMASVVTLSGGQKQRTAIARRSRCGRGCWCSTSRCPTSIRSGRRRCSRRCSGWPGTAKPV